MAHAKVKFVIGSNLIISIIQFSPCSPLRQKLHRGRVPGGLFVSSGHCSRRSSCCLKGKLTCRTTHRELHQLAHFFYYLILRRREEESISVITCAVDGWIRQEMQLLRVRLRDGLSFPFFQDMLQSSVLGHPPDSTFFVPSIHIIWRFNFGYGNYL